MTYGYWRGEDIGLDSTEGKDPKRTQMRTLGDDIGVYILLSVAAR